MSVYIIKRNKKNYKKKLENLYKKVKGLDAKKYCGTLDIKKELLEYQKELRNEWK
ncbi:MAG: hypothetical protein KGY75_07965 [Candidatus Cloacimonetes bacterium]|nr:hypothetical protein [Candidatus Cloacimonadota bacterium]MBS3768036.1 hypothetical protein [Candidatus Cloacimonadota bacterium]